MCCKSCNFGAALNQSNSTRLQSVKPLKPVKSESLSGTFDAL